MFYLYSKDQSHFVFLLFKNMMERKFDVKLEVIQIDWSIEFKPIMTELQREDMLTDWHAYMPLNIRVSLNTSIGEFWKMD